MLGQHLLAEIGDAEEHVQLRALVHPPQHDIGPDAELVWLARSQRQQHHRAVSAASS